MIWLNAILALVFALMSLRSFAQAEGSARKGNLAGVIWDGLWTFLAVIFAYENGAQVAQYMGWI